MKTLHLAIVFFLLASCVRAQDQLVVVHRDSIVMMDARTAFNNVVFEKSGQMHKTEIDFHYVAGLRTDAVHVTNSSNSKYLGWDFELYRCAENIRIAATYAYEDDYGYTDKMNTDRVPVKRKYILTFRNGEEYSYKEPFFNGNSSHELNLILRGPITTLEFNSRGDARKEDKIVYGDTVLLRKLMMFPLKSIDITEYIDERFHKYRPHTMGVSSKYTIKMPPDKAKELMYSLQSLVNHKPD